MKIHTVLIGLGALLFSLGTPSLAGESFPSQPIRLVVPTAAGGASDTSARIIAERLQRELKQSVIVENKTGASGTIGAAYVAKSSPDGYTLFFGTGSTHVVAPALMKDIAYDPIRDFTPIALVGRAPFVLFVNHDLPVSSLKDLAAYARKQALPLTFGTTGPSTIYEIAGLMLEQQAHIQLGHIPYRGLVPMAMDVSAGRVNIGVGPIDGYLKSGKLKVLCVLGKKRSPALPQVPSCAQSGFPDFDVPAWAAIWGPAGLPKLATARLTEALRKVLAEKATQEKIAHVGIDVDFEDGPALKDVMQRNTDAIDAVLHAPASKAR